MLNGQVDFCLVPYPAHFNMATTHEDMGREKLYLAGNRSHPAVQKALSSPRSADGMPRFDPHLLNGEYFISLKPGQVLSRVNRQFLTEHEITLAGMWNTENTVTSLNLVDRTLCFTCVPALCLHQESFPSNIVLMELGDPPLDWGKAIVYPKQTRITRIMRIVIDLVKEFYHNDPQVRQQYREKNLAEWRAGQERETT